MRYYLGMNITTKGIGYSVTDEFYNLARKSGKDLWGVRAFDEAALAEDRRNARASRNRRKKTNERNALVASYFAPDIVKIDPNFFIRLQDSFFHMEDKSEEAQVPNLLFNDENYQDKDYYHDFPTISHLKMELINNPAPHDVRLVYLAVSHCFRHRGHYFLGDVSAESVGSIEDVFEVFKDNLATADIEFNNFTADKYIPATDSKISRSQRHKDLSFALGVTSKDKVKDNILKLLVGMKADLRVFAPDNIQEKFAFSFDEWESCESDLEAIIGQNCDNDSIMELIRSMKALYDTAILSNLLKNYNYLSESRIAMYEKHQADLALLKNAYRTFAPKKYRAMFSDPERGYSAWINKCRNTKKKVNYSRKSAKNSRDFETFAKTIVSDLKDFKGNPDVDYIFSEIELGSLLPKQMGGHNSIIPNQLIKRELSAILDNAEKYLPFLLEKDEYGLTCKERILQLNSWCIPYFVGHTSEDSEKNGGTGWVVRKEDGPVLPWNIAEKIDLDRTTERFIERLVGTCTYLANQKCLPASSLLYEKFSVLQEINNLKIDGKPISVKLKQDIYKDIYQKNGASRKKLVSYLVKHEYIKDESQISGISEELNNKLFSYNKLVAILGNDFDEEMGEKVIEILTVFENDPKHVAEKITKLYGSVLTEEQITALSKLKTKKWGNLSREFIELEAAKRDTGEVTNLIKEMWDTNYEHNYLLASNEYTFAESLLAYKTKSFERLSDLQPEDLDSYYLSAPLKRTVWQMIKICKEIEQIMRTRPVKIFVSKPTLDAESGGGNDWYERYRELTSKYKYYTKVQKGITRKWVEEIEEDKNKLGSKKLYLYYLQMGKDAYTGEDIDKADLLLDEERSEGEECKYNLDHIYPKHFADDHSLVNNIVLTNKNVNEDKSDDYPLDKSIRTNSKVIGLWVMLKKFHFMSDEKYDRLTSATPLSPNQKADFILKQFVLSGHLMKTVADVLKTAYPDAAFVNIRSSVVSRLRQLMAFPSVEMISNNFLAHNAYLSIVAGNVYYEKFTANVYKFLAQNDYKPTYNLNRMFDFKVDSFTCDIPAWVPPTKKYNGKPDLVHGEDGTVEVIKKMLARNTVLNTERTFKVTGQFYNMQMSAADDGAVIPRKKGLDIEKYGGFKGAVATYFFLVEHDEKKGGRVRSILPLPLYLSKDYQGKTGLQKYCTEVLELKNPDVRMEEIRIRSLFSCDGCRARLRGTKASSLGVQNALPFVIPVDMMAYAKAIENSIRKGKAARTLNKNDNLRFYEIICDKYRSIYANRPGKFISQVLGAKEIFKDLEVLDQAKVIKQILVTSLTTGAAFSDLSLVGEASHSGGKMAFKADISDYNRFDLIIQSTTGFFEKKIDLLTC